MPVVNKPTASRNCIILRIGPLRSSEWKLRVWPFNGPQGFHAMFWFTVLKQQQSSGGASGLNYQFH
jgi:hypothetical protein